MELVRTLVLERFPGATIEELRVLGPDETKDDATAKHGGYGRPVRITLRDAAGTRHQLVFHTARADDFGHDRRADRAQEMLLSFDTFNELPRHVPALDVGVITRDGGTRSIADATELYLLTGWAQGELYAADLRRIVAEGCRPLDGHRCDALADYLTTLHARHAGRLAVYTRAVRDLVGSGEGIFGMVDGYPPDAPAAPPARLRRIEESCVAWRWALRGRQPRLARIHGDFHPFNIVFSGETDLAVLDASRGATGDPADDVTALAINYVFFALDAPGAWAHGLGSLWHRFWLRYLKSTGDHEILEVCAPWLAWRALVIANPRWYPGLSARGRDALLSWIERVLHQRRFDPASADEVVP